jgi:hypothetical protein
VSRAVSPGRARVSALAMRTLALACATAALLAIVAAPADAAFKSCRSIPNVSQLNGTRFAGSDIFRIRAQGVSCATARTVARAATIRALAITPPPTGIKRFRYQSWSVSDDLRGDDDRYSARGTGTKRITWLFGDA